MYGEFGKLSVTPKLKLFILVLTINDLSPTVRKDYYNYGILACTMEIENNVKVVLYIYYLIST